MGLECGKAPKEILMSENGSSVKLMDTECTHGLMETVTKANLKIASNMDKVWNVSRMVTFTKDFMFLASLQVLANITGRTGAISRVLSSRDFDVGKEFGRKEQAILTSTKGTT
jgi:hypothetical protein